MCKENILKTHLQVAEKTSWKLKSEGPADGLVESRLPCSVLVVTHQKDASASKRENHLDAGGMMFVDDFGYEEQSQRTADTMVSRRAD